MRAVSVVAVSAFFVLSAFGTASANGFMAPSVGAKAAGLAGAFIGLADDYSAAFWNPAGITQIEGTELTVVGQDAVAMGSRDGFIMFDGTLRTDIPVASEIAATSDAGQRLLPGAFFYPSFSLGALFDKVGIAAYTLTDYGTAWPGSSVYDDIMEAYATPANDPAGYRQVMGDAPDSESRLTAYAITPVVAKEIVPGLSFGLAGHAVYTSFSSKMGAWVEQRWEDSSKIYPVQAEDDATGWGMCATAGLLYKATKALSVGAVVRTPMTVAMSGEIEISSDVPEYDYEKQDQEYDLTFPMWAGLGMAYRDVLVDGLTMTADATWTQWSEFPGITRATDVALPEDVQSADPEWEDTIEVGVGLDYRMSRTVSLRLGYRNVPNPCDAEHYTALLPQTAKDVIGAGVTYRGDSWHVDLSMEYQAGRAFEVPFDVNYESNGEYLDDLMTAGLSLTYAF
jgi:long-chain fatty acid transport protein